MRDFDTFFSWPYGEVWGNLLASAITALLAIIWTNYRIRKLHHQLKPSKTKEG